MRFPLEFFVFLPFAVAIADNLSWATISKKLMDISFNRVNVSTEVRVIQQEAAKLKVAPEKLIFNCQEAWGIWAMTPEEYAVFMKESIESRLLGIFYPIDKFLAGIERYVPEVYSHETVSDSQPLIEKVLAKLDEHSVKFLRNLSSDLSEVAMVKVHDPSYVADDNLVSFTFRKMKNNYNKLSQESKKNLERETCWFTLLRLFDTENELANMILQSIHSNDAQFRNEL